MKQRPGNLTIVYGGQFGSEGKGEIVSLLCKATKVDVGVRVGGPNAGHRFIVNGKKAMVQTVPIPAFFGATGVIGPEGAFIPSLLLDELYAGSLIIDKPVNLLVDSNAAVITEEHMQREAGLKGRIGSTGEGVGAATSDKVMRIPDLVVKNRLPELISSTSSDIYRVAWDVDTAVWTNQQLLDGKNVLIEGTQGFGLGLHVGGFYPYCTSRECTPSALLAGTGISSENADEFTKVMVIRTFPIRVGGNSGPLANEITWEKLAEETGKAIEPEKTTVTKKTRRIGRIDKDMVKRAILLTRPSCLALTFLDYVFPELANTGLDEFIRHPKAMDYVHQLEDELQAEIRFISTGPGCSYSL